MLRHLVGGAGEFSENGHMRSWSFVKGQGTRNDFVLLLDRHGMLDPSEEDIRLICDRRAGVGADGLLRAIKAEHIPEWTGDPSLWFMDYRNADASLAEMCGNGIRVFARFLLEEGLADGAVLPIATRAGLRTVEFVAEGRFRVDMGPVEVEADAVEVRLGDTSWPASAVDVGNPHAVSFLDTDEGELTHLDLTSQPTWSPAERFPDGANLEFVRVLADDPDGTGVLQMRVHERGSGETESCGTGTVAAAAATAHRQGRREGAWRVLVPGGEVLVELADGAAHLSGPAALVFRGEITLPDRR